MHSYGYKKQRDGGKIRVVISDMAGMTLRVQKRVLIRL